MNKLTLVFFLINIVPIQYVCAQDEILIPWEHDYKLSWDDFQGQILDSIDGAAATLAHIRFNFEDSDEEVTVRVYNVFSVSHSFVDTVGLHNTDDGFAKLLEHEQLHFDISELHTRILRKRIDEQSSKDVIQDRDTILQIIYSVIDFKNRMNNNFDKETYRGLLINKKVEWRDRIDSLLNEHRGYYLSNEMPIE